MYKKLLRNLSLIVFIYFTSGCSFTHIYGIHNYLFPETNIFFKHVNSLSIDEGFEKIKSDLKGFCSYSFNIKRVRSSELVLLFNKIDELLVKNPDFKVILEELRNGFFYELTMEHLLSFRASLFRSLKELNILIDYWTKELNKNSFVENTKAILAGDVDKTELRHRVNRLSLFRDRIACYAGKVGEILAHFSDIANSYDEKRDDHKLYEDLILCVKEGLFCVNSFFSNKFDPDDKDYNDHKNFFYGLVPSQVSRILCKNHLNIKFMDENFAYQTDIYKIPSFCQRHWLGLWLWGFVGITSGSFILYNWDEFTGITKKHWGRISDAIGGYFSKSKDWLIVNLWPEYKQNYVDKNGDKIKNLRMEFERRFESKYNELNDAERRVFSGLPGSDNVQDYEKSLGQLFDALQREEVRLGELSGYRRDILQTLNMHIRGFDIAMEELQARRFGLIRQGNDVVCSLKGPIDDIKELVENLVGQLEGFGVFARLYQLIVYKNVAELLKPVEDGFLSIHALGNWIRVLIPATVVILSTIIIVKKIVRSRRHKKYAKVSGIVAEIYRVLNLHSSFNVDYYQADLTYKNQGLMRFYINCLKDCINDVSLDDKDKLVRLIDDLRNSNLSVVQKMNFIKLDWGKYLFGVA